ncbi:MAG: adenosylcobalamin-dependent ribonucleoside-diphosphate reductase [Anaerolineae bacterium]
MTSSNGKPFQPAIQPPATIVLSENSHQVLKRRYLRRGLDGQPIETIEGMFRRVARVVAEPDAAYGYDVSSTEDAFYGLLTSLRFFPNSPTFTGAGTPLGQLAACFTADMRVTTEQGMKRIADLQIGDRVLTHLGRYRPITELHQRAYSGTLLRIKIKLIATPLEVTPEHPIMTPAGWVRAGELRVGDKVAIGIPQGIRLTPHFDLAESVYANEPEMQVAGAAVRVRRPGAYQDLGRQATWANGFIEFMPDFARLGGYHVAGGTIGPDEQSVTRQGDVVYFEVQSIEAEDYVGIVYNCEVDEDHSYVTEGVVVHNCFVLPISDDLGKQSDGIFQTLRDAALIQQTGGGNGFSFSRLRPKGDKVASSAGVATGPVGFLRVYDTAFGEVAQGGCLVPDTLIFTAKGLLRLDEIVDLKQPGWQAHNLQVATDEGWRTSPHGYNNGIAPVLRVHTQQGLSLAGTPEHRVKILTENGPEWRCLRDLKKNDWIMVRLGQQRGKLQALRHPQRGHGNQTWPQLPSILDEELAFFLGYLTGNGFVASRADDHRVGVNIPHTSYLVEEMPALLERLFGTMVHRQQKPDDRSITLVLDNRAIKEFLQINGLDKPRSHAAYVPRLIRQSPPEVVGAYLRGLLEANGTLSHGYPCVTTTSSRLAEEVATLLIGLGCPVRLRTVMPGVTPSGKAHIYHVRIESSVGLQAWRDKIGCDKRSRFVVAHAWESDQRREATYVLPAAPYWLKPVLEELTLPLPQTDRRARGLGHKFGSENPRLRRALLRYLRNGRNFTRSAHDELCRISPEFAAHSPSPDGWWFVQVSGVEAIGEALTLDLEVNDNHTYLAYGMVTHNTRRGANMAVLRVDHPDIEEFISCKAQEGQITNFNISVGITDAFMQAVEEDAEFPLVNPRDGTVWRTVRARELFDKMVTFAHHNGEPGVLFLDTANRSNPVPHLYELEATNPCGEQFLGPYENCCLGSINLAQHITADNRVDWEKLRETTIAATRFLDNVVDANKYVPAVPQLREAALRARRIGLGIMGLGDIMYALGVRYGSEEGQEFAAQIMEFIRYHCMLTSIELARERGPFPAIKGSIYDPDDLKWQPPAPLAPYRRDWGRPAVDWAQVVAGIRQHGIRNAAQTTIAPTGTIGTVAGCEGYGCEPVFALAYTRTVKEGDKDLKLTYTSPLFAKALIEAGLDEATRQRIGEQVSVTGSCQDVIEVPEAIRRVFVVAQDITAEEHVRMQAAIQAFVDNSISKTINFASTATVEDVATAYKLAWKLGCKGLTVYVTGSRQEVVLETKATAQTKTTATQATQAQEAETARATTTKDQPGVVQPAAPEAPPPPYAVKRPRPSALPGYTYRKETPLGTAFITVNVNGDNKPFEVFMNVGKAGSDVQAVSEALGRLISLVLRLPSPLDPVERLQQVIDQLAGIGGGRALGFGASRVRSLPDAVAQVLREHLNSHYLAEEQLRREELQLPTEQLPLPIIDRPIGDLCPDCGQAAFVPTEGCRKCYVCGYSEC